MHTQLKSLYNPKTITTYALIIKTLPKLLSILLGSSSIYSKVKGGNNSYISTKPWAEPIYQNWGFFNPYNPCTLTTSTRVAVAAAQNPAFKPRSSQNGLGELLEAQQMW